MDLLYTFVGFAATLLGEMSWKILGELVDGKSQFSSAIFLVQIHYVKVIILNFFLQNQDGPQSEHQNLAYSQNLWVGNVGEASPTNFNSFSSKNEPC